MEFGIKKNVVMFKVALLIQNFSHTLLVERTVHPSIQLCLLNITPISQQPISRYQSVLF